MTRHEIRIRMRKPGILDRAWYRRINERPPLAEGSSRGPSGRIARLLPYRWRRFHHWYATAWGFYWLPCPLCGREHGGHEGGKTIPDPARGPGAGVTICAPCSRTRPSEEDW
jgi:hypothetical protein